MLYIGADHRGFKLKEQIGKYFDSRKIPYQDLGAAWYKKDDDYPDFAYAVAKKVREDLARHKGIVICGSGIGVNITANKVKGIRSSLVWSVKAAETLSDDRPHIIALPGEFLTIKEAIEIIEMWLKNSKKKLATRHERRLKKIEEIENNN